MDLLRQAAARSAMTAITQLENMIESRAAAWFRGTQAVPQCALSCARPHDLASGQASDAVPGCVGDEAAVMRVGVEGLSDSRESPLRAGVPVAYLAPRADRDERRRAGQVESVGVDEPLGVLEIAAQADSEGFAKRSVAAVAPGDCPGDPQVAAAVGHLGQLGLDLAGMHEGLVDIPERTGAADPGEVETGSRLTLGDIARPVNPHEDERHAARPGALQCTEAVRDGLVADVEPSLQERDVVAEGLRAIQECLVRQDQGTSKVTGEADPAEHSSVVAG